MPYKALGSKASVPHKGSAKSKIEAVSKWNLKINDFSFGFPFRPKAAPSKKGTRHAQEPTSQPEGRHFNGIQIEVALHLLGCCESLSNT